LFYLNLSAAFITMKAEVGDQILSLE
jgi:hypothetical protein